MLDRASGREPASWRTRLRKTAAGILVPSFVNRARADMHNLVLWKWGPNLPHRVTAYDPSGRLPKNQLLGPERRYSGNLLPPSPPAEKATAREDQAGQTSIGNRSRDRRVSVSRKSQFLG
jgi:hypothetical protein